VLVNDGCMVKFPKKEVVIMALRYGVCCLGVHGDWDEEEATEVRPPFGRSCRDCIGKIRINEVETNNSSIDCPNMQRRGLRSGRRG